MPHSAQSNPVQLVWFKKDLRVQDHAPLREAAARGPVLPLFIYESEQLGHEEFTGQHLTYLNDCLRELDANLRVLGTPLVLRQGEAVDVLERLSRELSIGGIWAHQETGNGVSFARDRRVRAWARARGLPLTELAQNGVVRGMKNRDGWADAWEERLGTSPLPAPEKLCGTSILPCWIMTHNELGVETNDKTIPAGGESVGRATLDSFLAVRGVNYMREMSSPLSAEESCSRLSGPLAYGTVSLRSVVSATRQRLAAVRGDTWADPRWVRSLRSYESRLHWHCHFIQRLESEPDMEFRNLNRALDGLREDEWNPEFYDRWAHGQTGYPLIDACVRMLRQTGWLNFRMRAMLVSFASQHLWLHWRQPGLFLARQWLDNEPGIHWSQMQMQSSTVGINRVRIYSPTRQAREQDPDGIFIRRWVPELADMPGDFLHAPWEWSGAARLNYPPPIVDENKAGRLARARIAAARASPEFEAESRRIYLKHGSRKKAAIRAERVARGLPARPPSKKTPTRPPTPRRNPMSDQPDLFGNAPDAAKPIIPAGLPESWKEALAGEFAAPYFHELKDFLVEERAAQTIYPPAADVFNALRFTPLDGVKVFILGQDPYHGPNQAHGLSFSVRPGVRVPPSLQNIYKELQTDIPGFTPPRHGYLRAWAEQGVLMLNAVLTVRAGQANSHANKGWEGFTDAVIKAVNAKEERVVFVLWGAYARKKAKLITNPNHVIVESAHPSPLSVTKFMGTKPFSKVNAALEEAGETPIDWQLPMQVTE
ncbi:uracil-DNA glycosylase [Deinococcus marmoris]|uniref:Uracil-DNA glycosylase n=1 Tax=Deinococcus marmoris TaxID=249408 RepID=A0A1U7NZ44_9DEIO|nr:uracil-DNA glycosylase [Deinococcus marmoris]OLV18180.1 Uracil-DNA glycosylase, family 1 [Deinococcus marmoris]